MTADASNGQYLKTSSGGYVYDTKSNAVLNVDNNEYERFIAERNRALNELELRSRVEALETLVAQLIEKIERLNG